MEDMGMLFSRKDLQHLLIPLLWETALAVAMGMVDTVMVASCGETAVSGVSLVDSLNVLIIQVFSALATGGSVVCSQFLGHRDMDKAQLSARQLYVIMLIASLSMTLVLLFLRRTLLVLLFGTIDPEVMSSAMDYFLMTLLSFPFLALYNASAALLRAMGKTKATLRVSLVSNVINVAGNAVTIYLLHMGAMGAGLATLISRAVASFLIIRPLLDPHSVIRFPDLRHSRHAPDLTRKILVVAVPSGLENGLFQLGKLILVRMIATFGTASIAANAVGNTMGTFHCLPGNAISLAMITVVGQCVGAGDYAQARKYTWKLLRINYAIQGILNILILLANGIICKPFNLSPETELLARQVVAIHGAGALCIWPLSFVLPNSLRAAGDARFTMTVSVFSMIVFRMLFSYLLAVPMHMGLIGVWLAMQIDWIFRIICFLLRLHGHAWETKSLV